MAYNFTAASSQYLTVNTPMLFSQRTVSVKFQQSTPAGTGYPNGRAILTINSGTPLNFYLHIRGTTIDAQWTITTGSTTYRTVKTTCNDTLPHEYAISLDFTNGIFVTALDGVASSGTFTAGAPDSGSSINRIGSYNNVENFNGSISEIGIWDSILTENELVSLTKGFTPEKIRPQSLRFYAPLVRSLIDIKGGSTITNNNGATVANHPRVYA